MKITLIRRITIAVAFVVVVIGLVFDAGTGTFSSFGWQAIAAICPLGSLESFLASRTIFPRALIVLAVALLLVVVFGKVFCSWFCPVVPLRSLFSLKTWKNLLARNKGEATKDPGEKPTAQSDAPAAASADARGCKACTSPCASKRAKLDSRHLVLGGTLLSAAIFGFPVFCLICPIGLTFGTVIILWQFLGFNDLSLSLLIYPVLLVLELVVLRKWCMKFCPLGALLSLMSLSNRFFRPKVDASKCLREQGAACSVCVDVCPENLDPHFAHGMNECSKCGLCVDKCPATAIRLPFKGGTSASSSAPEAQEQN